jgi:hypothetical protein
MTPFQICLLLIAAGCASAPPPRVQVRLPSPIVAEPVPLPAKAMPSAKAPAKAAAAETLLDVASLKARLRETKAIGTMAKLSLRNEMDDLLDRFRAHHLGTLAGGIASMRQPYDALVLKVLDAIQEGDPALARTISDSRERLWKLLADPVTFADIT